MPAALAWAGAVQQLGGRRESALAAGAELDRRYAEPHRRYHSGGHLDAVLSDAARLADELGLTADERALVTLAACAHDVVYDARPGEDERASAAWAGERLTECGVDGELVRRIVSMVLATATHTAPSGDVATAVLLDADLAILGADEPTYARYVAAVRSEYAAVPDPAWRTGRTQVLGTLLGRRPLYMTEPARRRWEAAARRNVGAELARLAGPGTTRL